MVTVRCVESGFFTPETGGVGRYYRFNKNNDGVSADTPNGVEERLYYTGANNAAIVAQIREQADLLDAPNAGQISVDAEMLLMLILVSWSVRSPARRQDPTLTNNKRLTYDIDQANNPLRYTTG